ncbi:MAG: DNA mismatch repair endonuclease MutL [Chloroflexi bacterium]|nr:DNA mismatch repair endonuclease MutL [Chloroflexota bacterium]
MPIHVLSDQLAAQIAAGEVIERPVSVVKELVENSIDAGATDIRIEIRDGGKRLIRVADNGTGIPSAEVELAFVHHATSKLDSSDDLFAIRTLGFRGEALPSIAAVAQATMLTRAALEEAGTEIRIVGGALEGRAPHAAPMGTVITVENLFFNIPARLKFLKSTTTEAGHVVDLVNRYALAYPHVRFSLQTESRQVFQTSGNGSMQDVLIAVYGLDTARQMIEVAANMPGADGDGVATTVSGYTSLPALTRANRSQMVFFVNGRSVQDRNLNFAVTEAYHTLVMVGRHPFCILRITLPPDEVDVNVHPTKAEVRFRDSHAIFSVVQRAVRAVLVSHQPVPDMPMAGQPSYDGERVVDTPLSPLLPVPPDYPPRPAGPHLWTPELDGAPRPLLPDVPRQTPLPSDEPLPMLRVLGQVARTYIVAEGPEGIFLIDQHAAHERVLYEQFKHEHASHAPVGQSLLEPLTLELTARQATRLESQIDLFQHVGFQLEPFGGSMFLVRAVPGIWGEGDPRQALAIILDELADEREWGHGRVAGPIDEAREARLIASVCKQAAIKAGRLLAPAEMHELIRRLESCRSPRTCPHGRPTMIRLGLDQLSREFGRI